MPDGGPVYPNGSVDRRGFRRLSITESVKLEVVDSPPGSAATFGCTRSISRGGFDAVVQGASLPVGSRCIVRFLSRARIKPVMAWGAVVDLTQSAEGRVVRVEFDTPLESLRLAEEAAEWDSSEVSVLVVDDDPHVRELLERFLTEQGYRVQLAVDGQQGLDAIRSELPHVLLLDIYMPGLNGLEVLERMQQEELKPRVVVTISGEADHESARQTLHMGAHDFLLKPFDLSYLDWAIRLRL